MADLQPDETVDAVREARLLSKVVICVEELALSTLFQERDKI